MRPRILVLGCNGQVGWELTRALQPLGEVVAVDREQADFLDPTALEALVRDCAPQVIVNAAAHTAVDKAESERDLAYALNAKAPGVLARAAAAVDALLVHYSTDYVFDGAKPGAYTEADAPNPQSVYGASKLAGEQAVAAAGGRHLIFRLQWVHGSHGGNFLRTILRLAGEREALRIVADQVGAPTGARLIADVTAQAIARVLGGATVEWGVYLLAASGRASWHEFASYVVERARTLPALGAALKVREIAPIGTADYPLPAARPANSLFNCSRLESTFGLRMPTWQQGVDLTLAELAAKAI